MATSISSHVKDKNSIFTARDEDDFLVKGKILVFHQYLYNKTKYFKNVISVKTVFQKIIEHGQNILKRTIMAKLK